MTGAVLRLMLPRGFGFVLGDDGVEYFLHAKELPEGQWSGDTLHKGVRMEFTPTKTEDGWRATEVRLCSTK